MKRKLLRGLFLSIVALACTPAALAADYYLSLAGAGLKNGSDWANAFAIGSLGATVNTTMQPGDTLYISGPEVSGGADYTVGISLTASGTSTDKKQLIGVDRGFGMPVFRFTGTVRDYTGLTIGDTVSHWTIKNLTLKRRKIGVGTTGAGHAGLTFENVIAHDIGERGFSLTDCDDLLMINCRAQRYSERGFVFGSANDNVTLLGCVADFTNTGDVDDPAWRAIAKGDPVGFDFHAKNSTAAPNTDILMEDCVAMNNDEDTANTSDYEQGDGIKFERGNDGITLRRCLMLRNQDGGCDLKGSNQLIEDCVAANNKRYGFKIWYEGTFNNCIAANNGARQLQIPGNTGGHTIYANFCTFHNSTNTQFSIALDNTTNSVQVADSILSYAGAAGSYNNAGVTLTRSSKLANTSTTTNSPRYLAPVSPWNGTGTNFDNATFGLTRGYNSLGAAGATILPGADTYAWDGSANTNYGTANILVVKAQSSWNRQSFLRFPTSALSGPVNAATLRIKTTAIASEGSGPRTVEVRELADDSWSETGLTWNNRPSAAGALIASFDAGTVGQEYTVDVTSYVNAQLADGAASFVITQPSGLNRYVAFGSRESGADAPGLDVD
jgi:hypothetical protein